jgi:hypothetical protein
LSNALGFGGNCPSSSVKPKSWTFISLNIMPSVDILYNNANY